MHINIHIDKYIITNIKYIIYNCNSNLKLKKSFILSFNIYLIL